MISPVVVRVSHHSRKRGTPHLEVTLEAPPIGNHFAYDFRCDLHAVFAAPSVRDAGELLFNGLSSNPDVKTAFDQAMLATIEERRPILLELFADETVDALPWETLYVPEPGRFVGLDIRWSVGRRVESMRQTPAEGRLLTRLQMAVVLSCLGIPAEDEWDRLRTAVEESEKSGLAVEMLLFVGEPDLAEALKTDWEAAAIPWVRAVKGIPDSAEEFRSIFDKERKDGFTPQVLHFFTHGSTEGEPHLEVATPTDWCSGASQSSLTLGPNQVRDLTTDPGARPWLIVLNSCLGAATSTAEARARQREATHSLARELVQDGGFPAVVGMREPIETADATLFSSGFYPQLFDALGALPCGKPTALDWSKLLVPPRCRLAEQAGQVMKVSAGKRKQWTLPVLYLRGQELQITRPGPVCGPPVDPLVVTSKLELLREILASLGADAPQQYRDVLEAQIARLESGQV